ncbi:MAG: shikimate kinase [Acidimicrobiia bacterium]|nr:shikimate kinase [Acidimicrobiia bacterium]
MSGRHLVLVGMMGSGKSSVGRRCAERLGRPLVDTDELVEATAGATVAELFGSVGEAGFRDLERAAVADVARSPEPLVVSCGGGAVLDPVNRRRLRDAGFVVWLHAPPEVLAGRVGGGSARPLLAGGEPPLATLERLAALRAAAYAATAHTRVETADRTVDEVTDAVLEVFPPCDG